LSHERTGWQLMRELEKLFGFKVTLRRTTSGFYLEGPAGERASIGDVGPGGLLSPRDQEAICENFGLDATLLGLNPRVD
jgi:hypothetical protein